MAWILQGVSKEKKNFIHHVPTHTCSSSIFGVGAEYEKTFWERHPMMLPIKQTELLKKGVGRGCSKEFLQRQNVGANSPTVQVQLFTRYRTRTNISSWRKREGVLK